MDITTGQIIAAASFAGAITALAIVTLKPLARQIGLVDCPGGRKHHEDDIPLIGGIAIFLGLIAGIAYSGTSIPQFNAFVTASSLLFVVGIIDDYMDIPAISKLVVQIIAALIMVYMAELKIEGIANLILEGPFYLGIFSVPVTVLAIVGYINAMNMTDGVDGLAGSLSLISTVALIIAAYLAGMGQVVSFLGIFAATLVIFLIFNARHPLRVKAGIFLGDAGSLLCGFIVAWFVIYLATEQPTRAIDSATALWIIGVPFIDLTAVMLRRILKGKSPFSADREHFHHLLLTANYSVNQTVIIISTIAVLFAGFGLLGQYLAIPGQYMFYIFAGAFVISMLLLRNAWKVTKFLSKVRLYLH